MATEKQIAANRANAQKSTGPRSVEGKIRAARNAVRHALSAGYAVLRIEAPDELERLQSDAIARYQPIDAEEMFAVERIALAKLAILRAARLEAGMFTNALNDSLNDNNVTPFVSLHPALEQDQHNKIEQIRNYTLGHGFERLARRSNAWSLVLRYQAQAERQYRRAVESFEALRKRREIDFPNEPDLEPQSEETEPVNPVPNEPDPPPANPIHPGPRPAPTTPASPEPAPASASPVPSPPAEAA